MASHVASANYRGERCYLGSFPTKRLKEAAIRAFRESLPDEVCPCGAKFRPLLQAQSVGWTFCPEHRKQAIWMRYRYSLTNDEVAAFIVLRPDGCFVCGSSEGLMIDHCHATGKSRGWLCRRCNLALGMVEDDIERLTGLILYLKGA